MGYRIPTNSVRYLQAVKQTPQIIKYLKVLRLTTPSQNSVTER